VSSLSCRSAVGEAIDRTIDFEHGSDAMVPPLDCVDQHTFVTTLHLRAGVGNNLERATVTYVHDSLYW
jgi:hypothetical protein